MVYRQAEAQTQYQAGLAPNEFKENSRMKTLAQNTALFAASILVLGVSLPSKAEISATNQHVNRSEAVAETISLPQSGTVLAVVSGSDPRPQSGGGKLVASVTGTDPRPQSGGGKLVASVTGTDPRPQSGGGKLVASVTGTDPRPQSGGGKLVASVTGTDPRPQSGGGKLVA